MTITSDKPRSTPTQQRALETHRRILTVARTVIERDGRDSFQMKTICREVGMSVGVVYRYFAGPEALLDALYPDRVEGLGRCTLDQAPEADS